MLSQSDAYLTLCSIIVNHYYLDGLLSRALRSFCTSSTFDKVTTPKANTFSIPEDAFSGTEKVPAPSQYFSNTKTSRFRY